MMLTNRRLKMRLMRDGAVHNIDNKLESYELRSRKTDGIKLESTSQYTKMEKVSNYN